MSKNCSLRIAYIGAKGLPSSAGADRAVEAITRRLSDRYELTVYCSPKVVPLGTTYPGVELIHVPVLEGKHLHAFSLFLMSALDAVIRRDFDLVHVHNVEACFILPLLKLKYKVIATSQGRAYLLDKWGKLAKEFIRATEWPYIKMADCVTSVSASLAEYYSEQYGRTVHYIPNGVALEDISTDLVGAQRILDELAVQPKNVTAKNYILFAAGRIIPTKGAHTLIEAYGSLQTALPLLVVGDISQVPTYEKRLRQLAGSRVVFISSVEKSVLLGLTRMARIFVFPSIVEAMSMMLLEAASLGAPIISSDIIENKTVLPRQALFFKGGDAKDLLEKIEWALNHPKQMEILGARAKAWVMENYQWDSITNQYEKLYRSVLEGIGESNCPQRC